jgi:hypothetical protein
MERKDAVMDLSTTYMGLTLKNPLVAAASPLSYELSGIKRLEDAGAGAVVLYSLFEEQIDREQRELFYYLSQGTNSFAEALSYFPEPEQFNTGPEEYLELGFEAGSLRLTAEHPVQVAPGEYRCASCLRPGEKLRLWRGDGAIDHRLVSSARVKAGASAGGLRNSTYQRWWARAPSVPA